MRVRRGMICKTTLTTFAEMELMDGVALVAEERMNADGLKSTG
jgi:hypothetical protein